MRSVVKDAAALKASLGLQFCSCMLNCWVLTA